MKIKKYQNPSSSIWKNQTPTGEDWREEWKYRLTPASRSKVAGGWSSKGKIKKASESGELYTKRRVKEETKRTWRSDVADVLHGIGEGVLALHPYTAIPYYGAKVGQDILNGNVNWETALNASIPLFHLSPQAVGLKEATNVALEDAANAGSKTARDWRLAREINLATKNEPNLSNRTISVKSLNNNITGLPDLVYTLYNEFGEPIGLTNVGGAVFGSGNKTHRMVDGVMSMRKAHKVSEDTYNTAVQDIIDNGGNGLESGWSLMMPLKTLAVTSKFPHTVIGLEFGNPVRLLTGTSKRPIPQKVLGNHYLELKPSFEIKYNEATGNFEQIPISNPEPYVSTSLKFFERRPARKPLSIAESLGIPRGDRGNLSLSQRQAIEDLALYRNSGQYRQVFRVTPDWEDFGWNLSRDNPTFMWQFAVDGKTMRGPWARVLLQTPTGKGVVSWNSERNMGGYSSKTFKLPLELKYSPGEANMMIDGPNQKIILTSPRVDIQDFMDDLASGTIEDLNLFKSLDSQLKRTIDKDVMKDFWVNSRKVQRPGSYMSGDNGEAPLGSTLIEAFKKKQLHKTPILETPIDLQTVRRTGLSPDSYSSIIRLGNRDGSLRWGEGFTNWNNSAIENKFVSDALTLLKNGKITPEQYEKIFNGWSLGIGGRPLLWITVEGLKIPVHPHPYIYAKKQGGKMNTLLFLKKYKI